jgi:hypothetical protein
MEVARAAASTQHDSKTPGQQLLTVGVSRAVRAYRAYGRAYTRTSGTDK